MKIFGAIRKTVTHDNEDGVADKPEASPFDSAPAIARGWLFIGVLVGTFGAWGTTAQLASTVIASGSFVVESSRKTIQHLEGGIVSEIFVSDGELVRRGDPLVQMDTTSITANLKVVRGQLDANIAERARLRALRDEDPELVFPASIADRENETRVAEIMRVQKILFEAERKTRDGQIDLLTKRVEITREQIVGLRAQKASKEEQKKIILREYAGLKSLFDKGLTPLNRVLALERSAVEFSGEIGSIVADIARAEKEISETDLEIVQLLNGYVFELNDQIKSLDVEIAELDERRTELEDVLRRSTVVAPSDGRVLNMAVAVTGEVLPPGGVIMEIVPVSDHLVVQANIRPQDVEQVAIGQQAKIHLTAFDQKNTPAVKGIVSYVSADILEDERTGAPYYEIKIAVPDDQEVDVSALSISAGMPAEAFVVSGSRTMLEYLSTPIISAMNRAMNEK